MKYDICIVGGAGHIGSPLAILFANKGFNVLIYDINKQSIDTIKSGKLPFLENDHEDLLKNALNNNKLFFTTESKEVANCKNVIITIGTPIDEFHNPKINEIIKCLDDLPISNDQLLVLRSTVFPGVTEYVERYLKSKNITPMIAFCPERIVQGNAIKEMQILPQIISGINKESLKSCYKLFENISSELIELKVKEAEFAKLFSNTYRYIQFAATNQFYEMATSAGLDYNNIINRS